MRCDVRPVKIYLSVMLWRSGSGALRRRRNKTLLFIGASMRIFRREGGAHVRAVISSFSLFPFLDNVDMYSRGSVKISRELSFFSLSIAKIPKSRKRLAAQGPGFPKVEGNEGVRGDESGAVRGFISLSSGKAKSPGSAVELLDQ